MPIRGIKSVSAARNGVGAFILQCKRLDFHYCDFWASSTGMNKFLLHNLRTFALENPSIEIRVSPRPNKHPLVRCHYLNGRTRAVCMRNLEKDQILKKLNMLKEASGERLKRVKKPVSSINESVRGIWSPFHGDVKTI